MLKNLWLITVSDESKISYSVKKFKWRFQQRNINKYTYEYNIYVYISAKHNFNNLGVFKICIVLGITLFVSGYLIVLSKKTFRKKRQLSVYIIEF